MNRKLIAFDIDGTLYTSNRKVLDSSLQVLRALEAAGHYVTIATGRSYFTAQQALADFGVKNYVLCNGAYAYENHKLSYSFPIDKEELKKIVTVANDNGMDILYQTERLIKQQESFTDQEKRQRAVGYENFNPSFDFDIDKEEAIYQAIMFCNSEQEKLFDSHLDQLRFTRWISDGVDIVAKEGSKARTLALIAEAEGIAKEDIITFGDGENDIEMLKLAGLGVVMDNASDYVKSFGDYITKSNDEHGILHAAITHGLVSEDLLTEK